MKAPFGKIAGKRGVAVPPVESASRGKREQGRARADARGAGQKRTLVGMALAGGLWRPEENACGDGPCGWPGVLWGGVGMGLVIWMF